MTGFLLSPGITPALVSACSVELPLTLGLAYALYRGRGLEVAIGVNTVAFAAIKIYTDYSDIFDLVIAVVALLAGLVWLVLSVSSDWPLSGLIREWCYLLAAIAVALGALKIVLDFYDPFDTFVASLGIVAGALLFRWVLSANRNVRGTPRREFEAPQNSVATAPKYGPE